MYYARFLLCFLAMAFSMPSKAVELLKGDLSHSSYQVHIEQPGFTAGEQQWLAVTLQPKTGWHTYWKNPGDSGAAPSFIWSVPVGVTIGNALYAAPEQLPVGPLMNYGYHQTSALLFPMTVSESYTQKEIELNVIAEWLVCEIECVPQVDTLQIKVPHRDHTITTALDPLFAKARYRLPEPSYWDSTLTISKNNSQLLVFADKLDVPNIEHIQFFPEAEGVLTYAAQQSWEWSPYGLKLMFERQEGGPVPNLAHGLLQFYFEDGNHQTFELQPKLTLNIRGEAQPSETNGHTFTMPIWRAALFALVGGVILNLMPCVFPILSLKAFALVSTNYKSQGNRRKEGWAYTFGIWASFMVIVGVLVGLRTGGAAIGWGFQLQEPLFIGFLILLMVLVALSLIGVFHISLGVEGAGQSYTLREGISGSFAKGVLATLVATPCTAPFMAPAIGYALTQPFHVILLVFTMLAVGLALPFLALSYSDTLARMMPRPGAWMEKVKQGLAFPMLLTAAWLLYVYDTQAGSQAAFFMVISTITLSFGVWLHQQTKHDAGRVTAYAALIAAITLAINVSETSPTEIAVDNETSEQAYSAETLESLLRQDRAVFAYFTAEWCITCKVNEQVALHTDDVQALLAQKDIQVLKGDWTNRNAEIAAILAKFGRAGVPLYLYFPAGSKEPLVLPELLTKNSVIEVLRRE